MAMDELKYKDGKFTVNGADVSDVSATTEAVEIAQTVSANTQQFSVVDSPEYIEVKLDAENKVIDYRDNDGVYHYNDLTVNKTLTIDTKLNVNGDLDLSKTSLKSLENLLLLNGFKGQIPNDYSNANDLSIPKPNLAILNFSNIDSFPVNKSTDAHAFIEFWDMQGNYFKKKAILNAQGNSTLAYIKKNIAMDLCNDDWVGDETFKLRIGDWVPQDSFHLKANISDITRGVGEIAYDFCELIAKTRSYVNERPYKKYLLPKESVIYSQFDAFEKGYGSYLTNELLDSGAKCYPMAFPCIVYLNNEFYGIYAFQLKKHRDNYAQNKNNSEHIQLDGNLVNDYIWGNNLNWSDWEVRNPKGLLTNIATGHGYSEITTEPSEYTDSPDNVKPSDMTEDDIIAAFGSIEEAPKYLKYITSKGKIKYFQFGTSFEAYDGDYPKELLGEDTVGYDPTNSAHVFTNTVKQHIIEISKATPKLISMEASGATKTEIRAEFEKHFDPDFFTDYLIIISVLGNGDSIGKNWQWTTYDGKIWQPNPYDMDGSLGHNGLFNEFIISDSDKRNPTYWMATYYIDEIKARYKELLDKGIISVDTIKKLLVDGWCDKVGLKFYELEFKKWNESPCFRNNNFSDKWTPTGQNFMAWHDTDSTWNEYGTHITYSNGSYATYRNRLYQSLINNNLDNNPLETEGDMWKDVTWKEGVEYVKDSIIWYGKVNFYQFKAVESITDVRPITKFYTYYPYEGGRYESVYSQLDWVEKRLNKMQEAYEKL